MSMPRELPLTPDGRYLVVLGKAGPRLWRATKPGLDPEERSVKLVVRFREEDAELFLAEYHERLGG